MKKILAITVIAVFMIVPLFSQAVAEKGGVRLEEVRSDRPYDAIAYGLFGNQEVTVTTTARDGNKEYSIPETTGRWSVYIPDGFQPKSSLVMVLLPDGVSADDAAHGELGAEWIAKADETKDFAVAFIEAENAGKWNISESADGRDEAAFIRAAFTALRNKDELVNAFISVDKNCVSLVGYKEGATMASIMAAAWPQLFANVTLVEPTSYEKDTIEKWLAKGTFPYAIDNLNGYDESYTAGMIAMPMYVYPGENRDAADAIIAKWSDINKNAVNDDTTRDRDLEVSKRLLSGSVDAVYEGVSANGRFMGYPGGTIRSTFRTYSDRKFTAYNEYVDGYMRRWVVYTPDRYFAEGEDVPLVVCMHGSSASIFDIAEESRWSDLADEYGFVVAFAQGYPTRVAAKNPIPSWYSLPGAEDGRQADSDFIAKVVSSTEAGWNIDESRIYLTGHSMGSMMTQYVALSDKGTIFAAFGPVGYVLNVGEENADDRVLPMWFFKGEFDLNGNDINAEGYEKDAYNYWGSYMGITQRDNGTVREYINSADDKYVTTSFSIDSIPVVKYTQVKSSPHVYMPEEAELLWEFFTHWTRGEDGTSYYDGKAVEL